MAVFTPLDPEMATQLAAHLGLGELRDFSIIPQGSVNSNFRFSTSRGTFFVRIYEERDRREAELDVELSRALAAQGVPTPAPFGPPGEVAGKAAAAFPWIAGEMLCQASVEPHHARCVGAALAAVHQTEHSGGESRFGPREIQARLHAIQDPAYQDARALLLEALEAHVARRDPDLPRGLAHGDLFRDNVLWQGGSIAALIDFESASREVFVYDLAVTIVAWCYRDRFDRALISAMIEGYESVRPLSSRERAGLEVEACVACVRFATTRITDYAMKGGDDRVMKDYRRFLARLAEIEASGLV